MEESSSHVNIFHSICNKIHEKKMNIMSNKNTSSIHLAYITEQTNHDHKPNRSLFQQWRRGHITQGTRLLFLNKKRIMCITDIPFIIPRQIEDIQKQIRPNFERVKLLILRMDEYLVTPNDKKQARRRRYQDTSLGLRALAEATNSIQRLSFREMLSIDETLPIVGRNLIEEDSSMGKLFRQIEKIAPITDFQEEQDLIDFDQALTKHRLDILNKPTNKLSDMIYLKFCLMLEIQRDESESCLRILLHDIIFKFHLADFHLRCEIHVRKPIEHELVLEKIIHESHLKTNYSAEFVLWSGDWIVQQEVELYAVIKVESLSINKFINLRFWDMAHLHVKNVPHGASRIFLRELTPVNRPHRILSRGTNVGQVEIEVVYWSDHQQLSIHIVKIIHSHAERLIRAPETYVEVIFQSPFDIHDIRRTKVSDRSLNPTIDEEFIFQIPEKIAISDITIDLIFLEKSSLHHHPVVHGALTLSKHTDWYPVRKFWLDVEENPNVRLKDRFLFEGNIYD